MLDSMNAPVMALTGESPAVKTQEPMTTKNLVMIAMLVACGATSAPAPVPAPVANTARPVPADAAAPTSSPSYLKLVGELGAFSDAMCKCTTKPCAHKVSDEMAKWSTANEKNHTSFENLSADEQTTVDDLGSRMGDCMQKVK